MGEVTQEPKEAGFYFATNGNGFREPVKVLIASQTASRWVRSIGGVSDEDIADYTDYVKAIDPLAEKRT